MISVLLYRNKKQFRESGKRTLKIAGAVGIILGGPGILASAASFALFHGLQRAFPDAAFEATCRRTTRGAKARAIAVLAATNLFLVSGFVALPAWTALNQWDAAKDRGRSLEAAKSLTLMEIEDHKDKTQAPAPYSLRNTFGYGRRGFEPIVMSRVVEDHGGCLLVEIKTSEGHTESTTLCAGPDRAARKAALAKSSASTVSELVKK